MKCAQARCRHKKGENLNPKPKGHCRHHRHAAPLLSLLQISSTRQSFQPQHSVQRESFAQACYGHTEGTAGVTGALLAAGALFRRMAPGIVNLREVNPYVGAAVADWRRGGGGRAALLPRQAAPAASAKVGVLHSACRCTTRRVLQGGDYPRGGCGRGGQRCCHGRWRLRPAQNSEQASPLWLPASVVQWRSPTSDFGCHSLT